MSENDDGKLHHAAGSRGKKPSEYFEKAAQNTLKFGWKSIKFFARNTLGRWAFWTFWAGVIITLALSGDKFYFSQYGILGATTFEHPDFKENSFRQRYYVGQTYYHIPDTLVRAEVKNRFAQPLTVETKLILPPFMTSVCGVEDAKPKETCDKYEIPGQGGSRILLYNITIQNVQALDDKITLQTTETTRHLFLNREETHLNIRIFEPEPSNEQQVNNSAQ